MGLLGKVKAGLTLFGAWKHFKREVAMAGMKATVFGLASGVLLAVITAVTAECPGLVENWQQILTTAVLAGVGKWLHSGRPK